MGLAIILNDVSFASANLGTVTPREVVPVESISIVGDSVVIGSAAYSVTYLPVNTSQRRIIWSVVSGGTYATIDEDTGELTAQAGADNNSVTIRATSYDKPSVYAEKTLTVTSELPYSLVSAIVSNGKQVINTGYLMKANTKVGIDYVLDAMLSGSPRYDNIWGGWHGVEADVLFRHLIYSSDQGSSGYQNICFGTNKNNQAVAQRTTGALYTNSNLYRNTRQKLSISYSELTSDVGQANYSRTQCGAFTTMEDAIFIFGTRVSANDPETKPYAQLTIYGFTFHEDDELVMNLVPCTLTRSIDSSWSHDGNSHSAGENGLWDTVANKFHGNVSGSSDGFTVIS